MNDNLLRYDAGCDIIPTNIQEQLATTVVESASLKMGFSKVRVSWWKGNFSGGVVDNVSR